MASTECTDGAEDQVHEAAQTSRVRRWTRPGTVEGHRNAMEEAAETRRYNRRMKELAAQEEQRKSGGFLSKLIQYLTGLPSKNRR